MLGSDEIAAESPRSPDGAGGSFAFLGDIARRLALDVAQGYLRDMDAPAGLVDVTPAADELEVVWL